MLANNRGVAEAERIAVGGGHVAMEPQLGIEVGLKSGTTEELQEESAHRRLPCQDAVDGVGKTLPTLLLFGYGLTPALGDLVVLGLAVVFRKPPFSADSPVKFQTV